jgi:hypothetical protein
MEWKSPGILAAFYMQKTKSAGIRHVADMLNWWRVFSVYGSTGMLRAQGSPRQPSNCLAPRIA